MPNTDDPSSLPGDTFPGDTFPGDPLPGRSDPARQSSDMDNARRLIDAVLDGRISPEQRVAFEELVVKDPSVAELYVEMMHLSCCLPFHVSQAVLDSNSVDDATNAAAFAMNETMIMPAISAVDLPDEDEEIFTPSPFLLKSAVDRKARRWSGRGGSAAAVLALVIALWWTWRIGHRAIAPTTPDMVASTSVNPSTDTSVVPPPTPPAVITATAVIGTSSAQGLAVPSPGTALHIGENLKIGGGAMELRFASGSVVLVQGPAIFRVTDQNAMVLEDGALTAHVPFAARGFQVTAPGLLVVDRGTDFGVRLAGDKSTSEAHVFTGVVDLTSLDAAGRPMGPLLQAVAGQAFAHKTGAMNGPQSVPFKPEGFARDFAAIRTPVMMHNTGDGISPGTADPHWEIVAVPRNIAWKPQPAMVIGTQVLGYVSNTSNGKWIGMHAEVDNEPVGDFDFQTSVDLTGFDLSTVLVSAQIAADNCITDIRINGTSTGVSTPSMQGPFEPVAIELPTNLWKPGLNQVEVILKNEPDPPTGNDTMMGLRVLWTAVGSPVVQR